MRIEIENFGNEIKFIENNKLTHYGNYSISWLKHKKTLFSVDEKLISTLKSKVKFSGIKHLINFYDEILELKLKGGLLKNYYECFYKKVYYQIIIHNGYKTSIFMNNKQIAYYDKKPLAIYDSQKALLICNSDINKDLIYSFISALELSLEQKENVLIDFGNIAKDFKPFDDKWIPEN